MSSNQSGNAGQGQQGTAQHSAASTTLGVGHRTSGEAGATCTHETMAETGGSGGAGLTGNQVGDSRQQSDDAAGGPQPASDNAQQVAPDPCAPSRHPAPGSAIESGARGFQNTRSEQAGGTEYGLGTPETGANQEVADLERQAGSQRK
jgi:hypothetical protein